MSSYQLVIVDELKTLRLTPMSGPIMGGTNVTIWGTGFLASMPITTPLWIKFGNLEYQRMVKDIVEDANFVSKDYMYDDLHMHPFRLRQAMSRLDHVKEGSILNKYQYAVSPDIRPHYHRAKNRMDMYIK